MKIMDSNIHHTYCLRMLFDRALLFQEFVERYVIGSLKNIRAPTLYLCIYMFFSQLVYTLLA